MRVAAPDKICDPLPILEHTDERVCGLTVFSRWLLVGKDRSRGSFGGIIFPRRGVLLGQQCRSMVRVLRESVDVDRRK
jgi:hypothetical protein